MVKMVKKIYTCPITKKSRTVEFPEDFAQNRTKYPFAYVFLQAYDGESQDIELKGKDILTTLYIDAHLNIRGVEAILQEGDAEIISKNESKKIISQLSAHIEQLQKDYDALLKKHHDLLKECGKEE